MLLPQLFSSARKARSQTFAHRSRRAGHSHKPLRFEPLEDRRLLAVYASTDVPQAIPDQGTVTSTLEVADSVTISDINVTLDISHTRDKDLDVFLIAPDQTRVELMSDVGGGGNDFQGTVLDDEAATSITLGSAPFAGSFQPEGSLAAFDGTSAQGTWTLEITDDQKRETGTLNSWSIDITPGQPPLPTISISDDTITEGDTAIRFHEEFVAAGDGGLQRPRGITFGPDGNLYVTSDDDGVPQGALGEVLRFDGTTGEFLDVFVAEGSGEPNNPLNNPGPLLFGPDGNLYVAGRTSGNILRFDGASGAFINEFVASVQHPKGMVFGPDGNLYVSSDDDGAPTGALGKVLRYDGTNGTFIDEFVAEGSGEAGNPLSNPHGLAFGPDGNLYVANRPGDSINRYDGATGAFIDEFIPAGSAGLDAPSFIGFRPDGNLYVASGGMTNAILVYDALTGALVDSISDGGLSGPNGWEFDSDGSLYVADTPGNNVLRFGPASTAVLTVSLSSPSPDVVTVDFATADGTATAGSDYNAASGTITFEPGVTTRTIVVPTIDDTDEESGENFFVNLLNPNGGVIQDGQGAATIIDDDLVPVGTKFFVADDGANQTFEYDSAGNALAGDTWNLANASPRGAVASADGSTVWVIDSGKSVFVYDGDGALQGSWAAKGGLKTPTGIASDGTDIWIVDTFGDKVLRYSGAALLTSGNQGASSSFSLAASNPSGITTDGTTVWVVDSGTDRVYQYDTAGASLGDWALNGANTSPTGLTIDPSGASTSVWVVDNGSDTVYEYDRDSGAFLGSFALAAGNTNPQGIADPPPVLLPPEKVSAGATPPGDGNVAEVTSKMLRPITIAAARILRPTLDSSVTLTTDNHQRPTRRVELGIDAESGGQPSRAAGAADRVFVDTIEGSLLDDDLPIRRPTEATDAALVEVIGDDLLDDDLLGELAFAVSGR